MNLLLKDEMDGLLGPVPLIVGLSNITSHLPDWLSGPC